MLKKRIKKVTFDQKGGSFVDPEGFPGKSLVLVPKETTFGDSSNVSKREEKTLKVSPENHWVLVPKETTFGDSSNVSKREEKNLNMEQISSIKSSSKLLLSTNSTVALSSRNTSEEFMSYGNKVQVAPTIIFNKKILKSSKYSNCKRHPISSCHMNHSSSTLEGFYRSPSFRVPSNKSWTTEDQINKRSEENEHLLDGNPAAANEVKKCLIINTWEEFYYGTSVLNSKRTNLPEITSFIDKVHRVFDRFLSKAFVEFLFAFIYFWVFFLTCFIYNMFWQFIGYILLKGHLQIHEQAGLRKIDIRFTGSVFQGPAYVYMRQVWCAHCAQISTRKITLKLMKDYREEHEKRKVIPFKK